MSAGIRNVTALAHAGRRWRPGSVGDGKRPHRGPVSARRVLGQEGLARPPRQRDRDSGRPPSASSSPRWAVRAAGPSSTPGLSGSPSWPPPGNRHRLDYLRAVHGNTPVAQYTGDHQTFDGIVFPHPAAHLPAQRRPDGQQERGRYHSQPGQHHTGLDVLPRQVADAETTAADWVGGRIGRD
jgi:hypothetical protein